MRVQKRNGGFEDYDVEKIHKVLEWATEGINGVSFSDIEMNASLSISDGVKTKDIHDNLIRSASNLISESAPNYQYVAARLLSMSLRKMVWGSNTPPDFLHFVQTRVDNGIYDGSILDKWSEDDFRRIELIVNHERDNLYTYAGLQQLVDKYLVKNRHTGEIYETPQFAYILIAMYLFDTVESVKSAYDAYSTFMVNLPTPIMAGVRTTTRQFASCVLVDVGDDLDSIFSSNHAVGRYTSKRAGIGLNFGRIRPINSTIRGGEVIHTGVIPYLKVFESTAKSTTQNGIRGGGATVHFPFWHYEIDDVLVLKNNAGTDDNRVRKLDYSIQFNRLFYSRLVSGEDITLFSPNEAKGLYEAFHDNEEFERLYEKYEKSSMIKMKRKIPARKLAEIYARERLETARIYSMNVDTANQHGSWSVPVYMSNLCQEIIHPTTPITSIDDESGEIGICMLSAINLLEAVSDEEIQAACRIAVRSLDSVIDYQEYPVKAGENFTKNRRSLGIGVTNLAGLLAKQKLSYEDPSAPAFVHGIMERIQWNLLNESCELAREKGKCPKFDETKYAQGLLPIDWYKRTVDDVVAPEYSMDWEGLRKKIAEFGLRHSTVSAIMPCESSSVVQNSTNGIEPVRNLLSWKKAKNGNLKQLVPNFAHRRRYYTTAFSMASNAGLINIAAVLQKFVDMSISLNLYYNYENYEDSRVPLSAIIRDQVLSYKLGIKNLYYCNSPDGDGKTEKSDCESGACSI